VLVWRYLDANEQSIGNSEQFPDQEAAEAWLAQEWEALHGRGVDEVMLLDEDSDVCLYRMGLGPGTD
jgi:phage-related protein